MIYKLKLTPEERKSNKQEMEDFFKMKPKTIVFSFLFMFIGAFSENGLGLITVGIVWLLTAFHNFNKKDLEKKEKAKWYSGWALFWWAILFFPGAIIYIIIKLGNKKQ